MSEKVYIAKESTSQSILSNSNSILSKIGAAGDTGSSTLFGKIAAAQDTVNRIKISGQTILTGGFCDGTEESPIEITGKGYLYVAPLSKTISGGAYRTVLSIDGAVVSDTTTNSVGIFCGIMLPFYQSVQFFGTVETYSPSYIVFLQE